MNTSSFLSGVLLGAAVSMMMSKKRGALMSGLLQQNGSMRGAGDKAKDKIMDMAMTGFGSTASSGNHDSGARSAHSSSEHKGESNAQNRENNLRMLKDFIRSNPDVKHEVEQILKDTHTAIPGL
ncbi:hypothetical protein [Paenibacillus graminis]|uniref:hypothetical protein n=1 Tax=Paenibacillus graminis TaxID=189425 RepID=UPI002DBC69B3|nr:hypothetical protein [Paenibacillus graminis]MEC0172846.1 hypothetical protein [Paenibacillus graminis]